MSHDWTEDAVRAAVARLEAQGVRQDVDAPRLARFQGLPDTYWLPEKKSLACRVIGNGVAVEVAYEAAGSLL